MRSFSAAAMQAMFSTESPADLIMLLTISGSGISEPVRLANGYTGRISETDEDVLYGVTSRGQDFIFLPMSVTLPSDEAGTVPTIELTLHDVTRQVLPLLRQIQSPPDVLIELVLSSTPDILEVSFPGFTLSSTGYTASSLTATLAAKSYSAEPFPSFTFTPSHFPGLF